MSLFSFDIIVGHAQDMLFHVIEVISGSVVSLDVRTHLWQRKWFELALKMH